jgi:hypothetical protein
MLIIPNQPCSYKLDAVISSLGNKSTRVKNKAIIKPDSWKIDKLVELNESYPKNNETVDY